MALKRSKQSHGNLGDPITLGPCSERTCLLLPQPDKDGFLKLTPSSGACFPVVAAIPSACPVELSDKWVFGWMPWPDVVRTLKGYFIDLCKFSTGDLISSYDLDSKFCKDAKVKKGGSILLGLRFPGIVRQSDTGKLTTLPFQLVAPDTYKWYVFLDGSSSVRVEVVGAVAKRRRPLADVSFEAMWENRDFTDCVIKCQGHSMMAHRTVLCMASSVFEAAFKGSMKESHTAEIVIDDARAEVVEAMLKAVYTGVTETHLSSELLPLAHRYELSRLVAQCLQEVKDSVTVGNVAEVARVLRTLKDEGDMYQEAWNDLTDRITNDRPLTVALMSAV